MPCTVGVDHSTGTVVVSVEGESNVEEIQDAMSEIWQTPEYRSNLRVLWDLRTGSAANLSSEMLRAIAWFQRDKRPDLPQSRVAVLVAREVDFGLMRMLGAFLPEGPLQEDVFRDAETAWQWLTG